MYKISKRLKSIADLVKPESTVVDVGTDHAYIPIYLTECERCKHIYATDIRKGPILNAQKNINDHLYSDKITAYIADGLHGIEEKRPDTVIIAGMGGELIRNILSDSEYVKSNSPYLILQPMTFQAFLRKWLWDEGFEIVNEVLCDEDNRIYQIVCAVYTGHKYRYTEIDCLCGQINLKNKPSELKTHIQRLIDLYEKIVEGKSRSSSDIADEAEILSQLKQLRAELL